MPSPKAAEKRNFDKFYYHPSIESEPELHITELTMIFFCQVNQNKTSYSSIIDVIFIISYYDLNVHNVSIHMTNKFLNYFARFVVRK